jgi:hypothetical protein
LTLFTLSQSNAPASSAFIQTAPGPVKLFENASKVRDHDNACRFTPDVVNGMPDHASLPFEGFVLPWNMLCQCRSIRG